MMMKPLLVCLMLLVAVAASAKEIEYGRVTDEVLLLDQTVPSGDGSFPIAILVHGGGWTGGDKAGPISSLVPTLTKAGYVCLSINYRLAPKHRWPACRDDVHTAIRWAKTHAKDFGGDPTRIALMGYSAGGHLAAAAATVVDDSVRVQAVVGLAPLTDFVQELPKRGNILGRAQRGLLNRPQEITPESLGMLRAISPINHIRPGLPPFYIVHGDADGSVPYEQSIAFQKKLKANGVACEVVTVPDGTHKLADWNEHLPGYRDRLIAWLNSNLKSPANDSASRGIPLRDVVYGEADGEVLHLDVRPGNGSLPQPVAILIHGGGWTSGDKRGALKPNSGADISPWFPHLQLAGFLALSLAVFVSTKTTCSEREGERVDY